MPRWDQLTDRPPAAAALAPTDATPLRPSDLAPTDATPLRPSDVGRYGADREWDDSDSLSGKKGAAPWGVTPQLHSAASAPTPKVSAAGVGFGAWDATPRVAPSATPAKKSRWDQTPAPASYATPSASVASAFGATPSPSVSAQQIRVQMTPEQLAQWKVQQDIEERNRPYSGGRFGCYFT